MDANDYDAELQRHDEVLRRTYNIRADDRVLDIGCGTGRTTRDVARSAREGSALGVDLSASMIERARELAGEERLHNVAFEQGDAQVHRFRGDGFDLAISRFGRCSSMTPSRRSPTSRWCSGPPGAW